MNISNMLEHIGSFGSKALGAVGLTTLQKLTTAEENLKSVKDLSVAGFAWLKGSNYIKQSEIWKSLSEAVIERAADTTNDAHAAAVANLRIKEVLAKIPGKVGTDISNLVTENKVAALAALAIPLSIYLYTVIRGTKEEKEILERKLRKYERESSSDDKSISDDKSMSDDKSNSDEKRSNRPQKDYSTSSRRIKRRKSHDRSHDRTRGKKHGGSKSRRRR
jgi:hypothetical protein